MGSRYEVEVTLSSAKDLKNMNWNNGPIRPYVVAWVDPDYKVMRRVDDTSPKWNQTLTVSLYGPVEAATLCFDVVHHTSPNEEYIKHLIGSAKVDLRDVMKEVGIGARHACSPEFKRPSGGPSGKLKLEITIHELHYHSYPPPPPPHAGKGGESRELAPYVDPRYGQPVHGHGPGYKENEKKNGWFGGMTKKLAIGATLGLGSYAMYAVFGHSKKNVEEEAAEEVEDDAGYSPPHHAGNGGDPGHRQPAYGHGHGYKEEEKKKSRFGGMGKELAIGAAAGVLGGLAAYICSICCFHK